MNKIVLALAALGICSATARAEWPFTPWPFPSHNPALVAVAPTSPYIPCPTPMPPGLVLHEFFPTDTLDFQILGGYYVAPVGVGAESPTYNFAPGAFRIGIITDFGFTQGILRGNFEPMVEIMGAPVFGGVGTFFVGPGFFLRYNFVQPASRLVPYIQAGAGITYNNGFHDGDQTNLGQELEFLLQAQVGLRNFVTDRISFDIEGGLIHISNAGTARRNGGINALGLSIGFSVALGGPRHGINW